MPPQRITTQQKAQLMGLFQRLRHKAREDGRRDNRSDIALLLGDAGGTGGAGAGGLIGAATVGGDLAGLLAAAVVVGIRGIPFSGTAPTTGQVPTFDGAAWVPGAPAAPVYVGARVKRATNQTGIVTATWTSLAFDGEDNDSDAFHDVATNNSRLTVPAGKAGRYDIVGSFAWESNATGLRYARIRLNGATVLTLDARAPISGDVTAHTVVAQNYDLVAGDYVELQGHQTSGADRQVVADTATTGSPRFSLRRVG